MLPKDVTGNKVVVTSGTRGPVNSVSRQAALARIAGPVPKPPTAARLGPAPARPAPAPTPGPRVVPNTQGSYARPIAAAVPAPPPPVTPGPVQPIAPPAPPVPVFNELTDPGFKEAQAGYQDVYNTQVGQQQYDWGNYQTQNAADITNLEKQNEINRQNLIDDYASRGLSSSGLYAKALGDLGDVFGTQRRGLTEAATQYQTQQEQQRLAYEKAMGIDVKAARDAAIARFNQKYGIVTG